MFKRIRSRLDGNSEQGFTLIELLVVIIIIGILQPTRIGDTGLGIRPPWVDGEP